MGGELESTHSQFLDLTNSSGWLQQPIAGDVGVNQDTFLFSFTDGSFRLLNTHIAYLSKRAYVFTQFTWDLDDEPFVPLDSNSHLADSGYKVRPARVPLTAYINSPTTGAPWPPGDPAPRSVSLEWWDHLCPESERLHINTTEVNARIGVDFDNDEGVDIVEKWVTYIRSLENRCVNILWGTPRIIDFK